MNRIETLLEQMKHCENKSETLTEFYYNKHQSFFVKLKVNYNHIYNAQKEMPEYKEIIEEYDQENFNIYPSIVEFFKNMVFLLRLVDEPILRSKSETMKRNKRITNITLEVMRHLNFISEVIREASYCLPDSEDMSEELERAVQDLPKANKYIDMLIVDVWAISRDLRKQKPTFSIVRSKEWLTEEERNRDQLL
ncbi:hypothetical protein [Vibrio harveyi]|uniref:hypothetical protein n=1 Tax=Vibrio harveyi TaxID=669 RepID=UPI0023808836|nr:hypothetical protein [Vibrio harveyi]